LFFQQAAGRGPRRTLLALSYAALLAVALEAVQVIVSSRFPDVRDMLVVAGGALSGVVTCKLLDQRIRSQTAVALLLAGTTVAAAVQKFSPFRWSEQYREFNWVPFLPYYEVTTFVALSNFVESLLIYLPLGFVTEYLFPRQRVIVSITLFIVGSVFLLEFLQGCVEGRYPDITDVLGAGCGGIFGCWIAQTRPARQ
jgi:glycopeptide antibiotics resistance protein